MGPVHFAYLLALTISLLVLGSGNFWFPLTQSTTQRWESTKHIWKKHLSEKYFQAQIWSFPSNLWDIRSSLPSTFLPYSWFHQGEQGPCPSSYFCSLNTLNSIVTNWILLLKIKKSLRSSLSKQLEGKRSFILLYKSHIVFKGESFNEYVGFSLHC